MLSFSILGMCGIKVISPSMYSDYSACCSSLLRGALGLNPSLSPLSAFQGDPLLHQPPTCDAWPLALTTFLAPLCE